MGPIEVKDLLPDRAEPLEYQMVRTTYQALCKRCMRLHAHDGANPPRERLCCGVWIPYVVVYEARSSMKIGG